MLETNGWFSEHLPEITAAALYIIIGWIILHGIRRDNRDK